ncbi:MAG: hypothetical protein ABJC13_18495 [Acidobacteriota bacterium]
MPAQTLRGNIAAIVRDRLGVAATYAHAAKQVTPGDPIASESRLLKWYAVYPGDRPIPAEISSLARHPLESGALDVEGLGFVVLHRCGGDFYFLIVATWRNENELWETVWYKDGDNMTSFEPFVRDTQHLPTFCVWELVPVWHEQGAWVRFLQSHREVPDVETWCEDLYSGVA